ncbi:hypothetical protein JCM10213_005528 [Rhodosporidiobolus nylandii]
MSRAGSEPLRALPYTSTPPPNRRRPAPSVLSPLSSLTSTTAASPNDSFRSASYQPSIVSHSSLPTLGRYLPSSSSASAYGHTLAGSSAFSAAASLAGSIATTANPNGPAKFRRAHAKKGRGGPQHPLPQVKTANPDDVDLLALEEPDEVFRSFGVRDVRKLEKRASDAAAAKVAELRTMVGERYRDLLAAADSIVRMRTAAEKLVDRLDSVDDAVRGAGATLDDTPTKPLASRRASHRSISPSRSQTLSSAPTLSLTVHLLLSIPSLVHTHLSTSSFLAAARLERLSQVVYRELSEFEPDEEDQLFLDGDGQPRNLLEAFPIVAKQQEALSGLRPLILRRARGELLAWEADPLSTAQTLAAITLLQDVSPSSALSTLLAARTEALQQALTAPSSSRTGTSDVVASLEQVIGLVLRTVESATAIFGGEGQAQEGLLAQLLRELERPSLTSAEKDAEEAEPTALAPILTTLPNYATLSRHLPRLVLNTTPILSVCSALSPSAIDAELSAWLSASVDAVVAGVGRWISSLASPSPSSLLSTGASAKALSHLRAALSSSLARATPPSFSAASALSARLTRTIEARLAAVYSAQLSDLVSRVRPDLEALLLALPADDAEADRDPAHWLFETPLAFPSASKSPGHGAVDPFEAFLGRVEKRTKGRSPLLDRGLSDLEAQAAAVRTDLECWLDSAAASPSPPSSVMAAQGEGEETRTRLRAEYLAAARDAFDGVVEQLERVLDEVEAQVDEALFVGRLAGLLGSEGAFARDLLLGEIGDVGSTERTILAAFHDRLKALQERSLGAWREQAVRRAVAKIEEGMNELAASGSSGFGAAGASWAWDASRSASRDAQPPIPSTPSAALLSALHALTSSLSRLPLTTRADESVARALLVAFADDASKVAGRFAKQLGKNEEGELTKEIAAQAAWDIALLRILLELSNGVEGGKRESEELEQRFLRIASPAGDLPALSSALSASTYLYLQRTQSVFGPLIPSHTYPSLSTPPTATPAARPIPLSIQRLLPLGAPPSASTSSAAAVGQLTPALVKPGPRLGLLPTRG